MFKEGERYNFVFKFPYGYESCFEHAEIIKYDVDSGLIKISVNDTEIVINLRNPGFYGAF